MVITIWQNREPTLALAWIAFFKPAKAWQCEKIAKSSERFPTYNYSHGGDSSLCKSKVFERGMHELLGGDTNY